jgi:hypothetical protein
MSRPQCRSAAERIMSRHVPKRAQNSTSMLICSSWNSKGCRNYTTKGFIACFGHLILLERFEMGENVAETGKLYILVGMWIFLIQMPFIEKLRQPSCVGCTVFRCSCNESPVIDSLNCSGIRKTQWVGSSSARVEIRTLIRIVCDE